MKKVTYYNPNPFEVVVDGKRVASRGTVELDEDIKVNLNLLSVKKDGGKPTKEAPKPTKEAPKPTKKEGGKPEDTNQVISET